MKYAKISHLWTISRWLCFRHSYPSQTHWIWQQFQRSTDQTEKLLRTERKASHSRIHAHYRRLDFICHNRREIRPSKIKRNLDQASGHRLAYQPRWIFGELSLMIFAFFLLKMPICINWIRFSNEIFVILSNCRSHFLHRPSKWS